MPLIGVTTSVVEGTETRPARLQLNAAYLAALQAAGGTPLLLPPQLGCDQLESLLARLDGVLLTGGGDVDPALYGEPRNPATEFVSAARDAMERRAVEWAIEARRPLFAICRGTQVLNVALGGALYQHLPEAPGEGVRHHQGEERDAPTHPVEVIEGSRLASLAGSGELLVNSIHHQGVRLPGRGLRPVAWAPDGLIEAVESADPEHWLVGVQWHPEELTGSSEEARRLFAAFVEACNPLESAKD
jgi:putative glutamine amidotransferase